KRAMLDLVLRRESNVPRGEFWALRDISFAIEQGERIGIVGGNGAGKSTLLRLLARIYPPTSGRIAIMGNVAPLIEMGAGFNPELSGTDNIVFNGAMLGFSKSEMLAKAAGIYEFTGLEEFANLPLKYYSSGMYMRLAFAIATEIHPDILLIDEALGVGDAAFVAKAKVRLRGLVDRSKVVVIVSHDMDSLRDFCTRGLWVQHGRIVADGPIDRVLAAYLPGAMPPAVASAGTSLPRGHALLAVAEGRPAVAAARTQPRSAALDQRTTRVVTGRTQCRVQ